MTSPAERKTHLDSLAITLLVVCCAFWGFQQILIKDTVAEVPPLWQASLRFWGAAVLIWLWCQARGVPLFVRDGTLKAGLLAGSLFAGEFAFIYLGLRRIQWVGLVIAFAAVALAFSEGFMHGSPVAGAWLGDAMALAAGTLWGLTTLTIRATKLSGASAEKTLFYQVAVTAVAAPLISLALGEVWALDYSARAWGSLGIQTVVGAFASYLTWMWLLRHYPATQMSTFTFLTPVFALVFGVVLLNEPLTPQLVVALVGVALGIVLVSRRG